MTKATREIGLVLDHVRKAAVQPKVHVEVRQALGHGPPDLLVLELDELLVVRPLGLALLDGLLEVHGRHGAELVFNGHAFQDHVGMFAEAQRRLHEDTVFASGPATQLQQIKILHLHFYWYIVSNFIYDILLGLRIGIKI
jgi:hypothetical protein